MKTGVWPVGARGSVATTAMAPALTGKTRIVVHADSPTGPLVGKADVSETSGALTSVNAPVTDPGGTHKLFMAFKGGSGDLFTFDAFTVNG